MMGRPEGMGMEDTVDNLQALITLGKDYRRRGMHENSRDAFRRAATMAGRLHLHRTACFCWTQHQTELEQCRPVARVNVSALVD